MSLKGKLLKFGAEQLSKGKDGSENAIEKITGLAKKKFIIKVSVIGGTVFLLFIIFIAAISYFLSPYLKLAAEVEDKVENFKESVGNFWDSGCWGLDEKCDEKAMKNFLKKVQKVDKTYKNGKKLVDKDSYVTLDLPLIISSLLYEEKNDKIIKGQLSDDGDNSEWASENGYNIDSDGVITDNDGNKVTPQSTSDIDWDNVDTDDTTAWIFGSVAWYAGIGDDTDFHYKITNDTDDDPCGDFKYWYDVICSDDDGNKRDGKNCSSRGDTVKWRRDSNNGSFLSSGASDLRYLAKKMVHRVGKASCKNVPIYNDDDEITGYKASVNDWYEYEVDSDFFKDQLTEFYIPIKFKDQLGTLEKEKLMNKSRVIANRMFDMSSLYKKLAEESEYIGSSCTYTYTDGATVNPTIDSLKVNKDYISKIRVNVLKPDCNSISSCSVDYNRLSLKDYIIGVVYREIGVTSDTPVEHIKANIIAARSYTLGRSLHNRTIDYSNDLITITMKNSTQDQVFCHPTDGCNSSAYKTNKKPAMSDEVKKLLSKAYDDTANKLLYDEQTKKFVGAYTSSSSLCDQKGWTGFCLGQNESREFAVNGRKYTDILAHFYSNGYIGIMDATKNTVSVPVKDCSGSAYIAGIKMSAGAFGEIVYYNQKDYDSLYGTGFGVNATIKSHGCGTTSMAIVLSSFLKASYNPVDVTKWACDNGYCSSAGTYHSYFKKAGQHYGLSVSDQLTNNEDNLQKVADALATSKSLVIALMGPGTFTSGGHYIVLTAINSANKTVLVADPYTVAFNKYWPFETIAKEASIFWTVSK